MLCKDLVLAPKDDCFFNTGISRYWKTNIYSLCPLCLCGESHKGRKKKGLTTEARRSRRKEKDFFVVGRYRQSKKVSACGKRYKLCVLYASVVNHRSRGHPVNNLPRKDNYMFFHHEGHEEHEVTIKPFL